MTWHPTTIVVAVDGSERSIEAAQVAAELAKARSGKLFIFTAVRPPEGWWGIEGAPPPPKSMSNALVAAQQQVLDTTVEQIDLTDVNFETALAIGEPSSAISSFCTENEADVLVIGRRGAGVIERFILGSVADRLVHYAPCPVLVVP